jgi:methionyl-tRNA synthetase
VQDLFDRCRANGYIYKGSYTGPYCPSDNLFVTEAEKVGDPCPLCGRPTEEVTEENFFFKLSAFQDRLLELYETHPDFIQPDTRRNEVIAFLKQGLQDLSVTRTGIKWGIPVKGEAPHVFYVWFDALSAYMTAVAGKNLWPADLHLIGKEIVRFHAIYWPAFLWAAGLPLPKRIFAHGWLLFEQEKMSKSRGNIVRPEPIRRVMGTDALRYYLLREIAFGQDGSFSYDALVGRFNSDHANGLGNLASRALTMITDYLGGTIPAPPADSPLAQQARETVGAVVNYFEEFQFHRALETIWSLLSAADKYIVEQQPWRLNKTAGPEARAKLEATLYTSAEVVRMATVLLAPVIPDSAENIWRQLGMTAPLGRVKIQELTWGQLAEGQKIGTVAAVFPRLDVKKTVEQMAQLEEEEVARQAALLGKTIPAGSGAAAASDKISIEDFAKVELRVGQVVSAEHVKGADKLLHLKVDIGEPQPRTLVAGIAEAYTPEQIVGRKVVIVANLQPRKLRGIESNGMIVAASVEGGKPVLAGFNEEIPIGARLK